MLTPAEQAQYAERDAIIRTLGFSSYKVYLVSELWKTIRRQVLLPNTSCRGCGRKATQVHHSRYKLEDMNGACLAYLIPVCGTCHNKAEFTKKGSKLWPQRATDKLNNMAHARSTKERKTKQESAKSAAWRYLFTTIEDVRIYLGMDVCEEAQRLAEQIDTALAALPPPQTKKAKRKKRRAA